MIFPGVSSFLFSDSSISGEAFPTSSVQASSARHTKVMWEYGSMKMGELTN